MKSITACPLDCGDTCSLVVDLVNGKITGNPEHPFTRGFCCPKGSGLLARLGSEDRITKPMLRKDGELVPVSWDEALDECARRIDALRDEPEKILHMRGYGYRGVLAKASSNFFEALGSTKLSGSVCDNAGCTAMERTFGSLDHNDAMDILNADRIVNWGKDMMRSSIHLTALVKEARKNGTEVLTISIGGDHNAEVSDEIITIRPGTDRFLAAAVLKLLFESGSIDSAIAGRVANWPEFRGLIDSLSLDELCDVCGVSIEDVEYLHDWYTQPGPVASVLGWGIQRHLFGGANVQFIAALGTLAGHVGRKGGGIYYNIASSRNFGSWALPGANPAHSRPAIPIHRLGRELAQADPAFEFIWIDGFNPANQVPEAVTVARMLERTPFVVVVDGFMNDTTRRADCILPPAMAFEREDIFGSCYHNYVNYLAPIMPARDECRQDFEIYRDLAERLAVPFTIPDREKCLEDALQFSNINMKELREKGFMRGDQPEIAYENMQFAFEDGKCRLPEELPVEPEPDADYPLNLLTLVRKGYIHSQMPESDQRGVPSLTVSADCEVLAAVDTDRDVFLRTPVGSMQVKIVVEENLHPAAVIMRRGGWSLYGQNANTIIEPLETDMGGGVAYYSQRCTFGN